MKTAMTNFVGYKIFRPWLTKILPGMRPRRPRWCWRPYTAGIIVRLYMYIYMMSLFICDSSLQLCIYRFCHIKNLSNLQ